MSKDNNVNLTDYILERAYGKDDSYSKEQINALLEVVKEKDFELFEIVAQLPTTDINSNRIYLVYNANGDDGNLFDVYIRVGDEWEQLDGSGFNLNDFYTKFQLDNLLYGKASKTDLNTLRNNLTDTRDSLTSLYDDLTEFNGVLIDFDVANTNLDSDLTKLKDNLGGFITRVNGLISSLDTLTVDMSKAQTDLTNAKSDLIDLKEDINGDGTPENQGLRNEVASLGTSVGNAVTGLNTARTQIISLQGQSQSFAEQLEGFDDDLNEAKSDLEDAKEEITGLKSKDEELTEGLSGLTDSLSETNSSLGETSRLLVGLKGDFDNLSDEFDESKEVLETATGNITALTTVTGNLSSTINRVDGDLTEAKGSLETTKTGLKEVHDELLGVDNNSGLKKDLNDLTSTISDFEDEIEGLQEEDVRLQESITGLSIELNGNGTEQNTGLRGDLEGLQTANTSLRTDIQKLQSDNATMSVNLAKLWEGLTDASGELMISGEDIVIFSQELDSFLSDLNVLGGYLSNFEGSLTDFKKELSDNNVSFETFELESNIVSLFGSIGIVKSEITGLQDTTDTIQGDIDAVNTTLYGKIDGDSNDYTSSSLFGTIDEVQEGIDEINTVTIPAVNTSINTVDGKVTTVNTRVDSVNTRIDGVDTEITNVNSRVDGVNILIGDENNPSKDSLRGQIGAVDTRVDRVDGILGDENNGLISDVNDSIDKIDVVDEAIDDLQTELYGGEDYSFDGAKTGSFVDILNNTNSQLVEEALPQLEENKTEIARVEGKVDDTQSQLNESIDYINNVQKILYGDSTNYYPCDNKKYIEYTINTDEIEGLKNLKFIVYPKNEILLHNISNIANGNFNNGLTGWERNINDNELIKVINAQNAVLFNAIDNTLILTQENIDFTNINEIKFQIKYNDYQTNNTHGGLFVYIGEESDDLGLMKNLSDFKDSLVNFNTTLSGIEGNIDTLTDGVDSLQIELYGGEDYSFESPKPDTYIDTINNTVEVIGDENSGLVKDLNDTIQQAEGFGQSLDEFGGKLDGVTNDNGDGTLDIAIDDITLIQEDMDNVYDDVDLIHGMVYGDKRKISLSEEWRDYSFNTKKYTGQYHITFELSQAGKLDIQSIIKLFNSNNTESEVNISTFSSNTITGTYSSTDKTENSINYREYTLNENTILHLTKTIDLTNIDTLSFIAKKILNNPVLNFIIHKTETIDEGLFGEITTVQGEISTVQGYVQTVNGQIQGVQGEIEQAQTTIQTTTNNLNDVISKVGDENSGLIKEVADLSGSVSSAEYELYGQGGTNPNNAKEGSIWYRIKQIYDSDNGTGSLIDLENKVNNMDTSILPHTGKYVECYVAEQSPSLSTLQSLSKETGYDISNIKYWQDISEYQEYYELVNNRWVSKSNLPSNIIGIYRTIKNKDFAHGDEPFSLAYSITTDKYYELSYDYYG